MMISGVSDYSNDCLGEGVVDRISEEERGLVSVMGVLSLVIKRVLSRLVGIVGLTVVGVLVERLLAFLAVMVAHVGFGIACRGAGGARGRSGPVGGGGGVAIWIS